LPEEMPRSTKTAPPEVTRTVVVPIRRGERSVKAPPVAVCVCLFVCVCVCVYVCVCVCV
jgi:hypothetical protein